MTYTIHESWNELQASFEQILTRVEQDLCIFDDDLVHLGLRQAECFGLLQSFLLRNPKATLRIALRRINRLHQEHPRLVRLVASQSHRVKVRQIPNTLQHLRDAIIIADRQHTLTLFELAHPRFALILDDPAKSVPYAQRFSEIWDAPCTPFEPTPLGLY
ncbi:MAG: hypothetical protein LBJ59_10105 [Zoogloeaceae bacterium]|jgi:hypothetical protein|nr:hypothetical protein [Zoogloeaceae bacterium]